MKWTDRQMDEPIERWTDKQIDRWMDRYRDGVVFVVAWTNVIVL